MTAVAQWGPRRWSLVWRRVLYSLRTSVVVTVALVPPLIDQIFRLVGGLPAWLLTILLAVLLVAVSGVLARKEQKLVSVTAAEAGITKIENVEWIETLICTTTMKAPPWPRLEPVQTLLLHLPNVRAVHLICSQTADVEAGRAHLREWMTGHDRAHVSLDAVSLRLDANQITDADVDRLSAELRHIHRSHAVVDITGGTRVMGFTAYEAAVRAGLPVTYVAQVSDQKYAGLSALSDPDGVFVREGS